MKVKIINHNGDANWTRVVFVDDDGKETEIPVAFVELSIHPDKPLVAKIGVFIDLLELEAQAVIERVESGA